MSTLKSANKTIWELTVLDIEEAGLPYPQAQAFYQELVGVLRETGPCQDSSWKRVSQELLKPDYPFALHQLLYYSCFKTWNSSEFGPPPAWIPDLEDAKFTNVGDIMEKRGRELLGPIYRDPVASFNRFHQLSVENPEIYWSIVLEELNLCFHIRPLCILNAEEVEVGGEPCPGGRWLPGAVMNSAECCLHVNSPERAEEVAVVWRDEGYDDGPVKSLTVAALRALAGFSKGDAIAIDMPMSVYAVIIYLAIVLAGCVVVSIADSFAPSEISSRLQVSKAKAIFTQDVILRGQKALPLYARVVEADAPMAIVLSGTGIILGKSLRKGDMSWESFLAMAAQLSRPYDYTAAAVPVEAISNILFSSGTTGTGEPKAIPWTHATPIKAAADAWAHHDIRNRDVVAWPTNLGWMMGPWLIYAALLNRACIALYNGSPLGRGFATFIQDARVTMLGVVPSIVKAWRNSNVLDNLDWSHLRCFSSTGEASNVDDYLWLMGRAGYKPVIEYCGGTEIGGGFATGSLLQTQSLAAFSTPAMGCTIVILDDGGHPLPLQEPGIGECALVPTMLGASMTLLNANHFSVYFNGMPFYKGKVSHVFSVFGWGWLASLSDDRGHRDDVINKAGKLTCQPYGLAVVSSLISHSETNWILRRHGDEFERTVGGFYRALGRVDDTMNLGGIKVSSVEIERVCNAAHSAVLETAAIGVPPTGGGPEQLLVIAVLKGEAAAVPLEDLKKVFNLAIQSKLNPLFKVNAVVHTRMLPRTASNKVMRRALRSQYGHTSQMKCSL